MPIKASEMTVRRRAAHGTSMMILFFAADDYCRDEMGVDASAADI